jgi:hypothetical protein
MIQTILFGMKSKIGASIPILLKHSTVLLLMRVYAVVLMNVLRRIHLRRSSNHFRLRLLQLFHHLFQFHPLLLLLFFHQFGNVIVGAPTMWHAFAKPCAYVKIEISTYFP